MNENDTQIITRKLVIKPTFSSKNVWHKKVMEFTINDLNTKIENYKEWICNTKKNKKFDEDEKMRRLEKYTSLLANCEQSLKSVNETGVFTQSMVNNYTYSLIKDAMESEARMKNYILSWMFATMIENGVQYMDFKEQKKFINEMIKPAYRVKGSKKGGLFDDVEIKNILSRYGISFSQELTRKVSDSVKNGLLNGKVSLPTFKLNSPFSVAKEHMGFSHDYDSIEELFEHIHEKDCKLYFDFGGRCSPTIARFTIDLGKNRNKDELLCTLMRVYSGEYKYCGSSIQFDKSGKKIVLNLSMEIPVQESDLNEDIVVGVDLGQAIPAVCALNTNSYVRESIGSINDFLKIRTQIQNQRRNLSKQLKFTKGGHGRKKKLQALNRYESRESNFVETYNHMVSNRVVAFALKHHAKYINLESLKGFDASDKVLRNWSYYQLQQYITYKANKYGIIVRKINPCFTSQVCSCCGTWAEGQRKSQSEFVCSNPNCETHKNNRKSINADYNAARNIAKSTLWFDGEVKEKHKEEAAKYYNIPYKKKDKDDE